MLTSIQVESFIRYNMNSLRNLKCPLCFHLPFFNLISYTSPLILLVISKKVFMCIHKQACIHSGYGSSASLYWVPHAHRAGCHPHVCSANVSLGDNCLPKPAISQSQADILLLPFGPHKTFSAEMGIMAPSSWGL